MLEVNQSFAALAMNQCKSGEISTTSRLGIGLILLAGGRTMECMRTHGVARATVFYMSKD